MKASITRSQVQAHLFLYLSYGTIQILLFGGVTTARKSYLAAPSVLRVVGAANEEHFHLWSDTLGECLIPCSKAVEVVGEGYGIDSSSRHAQYNCNGGSGSGGEWSVLRKGGRR